MYIKTLRDHRFVDGILIPKGKILHVLSQGKDILTVDFDGTSKMLRVNHVQVLNKYDPPKNGKAPKAKK